MRRYSFVDGYRNDGIDPVVDLGDERLPEDNDDVQFLSADEFEFLPNEKSSDYTLLESSPDNERNEKENERAFSRKYKHRKKPNLEFLDFDASTRLNNEKRMTIRREDEDIDYEDGGANENNSAEIERSDISSKISGMYTEGGVVRPLKHEIDASGEFIALH